MKDLTIELSDDQLENVSGGRTPSYFVERIEGNFVIAIGDDGQTTAFHREELPKHIREGDVILYKDSRYVIDAAATSARRKEMLDLADVLFNED